MIRVAIVEDEKIYAQQLTDFLHRYEAERKTGFEITYFTDGDGIISTYKSQYDIILMDVQMRFMDGMSAAEEIRKVDSEVILIFITNMGQYAIRGYEVDALDYLVKPVSYFAFSERLKKAINRIDSRRGQNILISIHGGVLRIDTADIWYVESRGHVLIYHTVSGVYEGGGAMKTAEELLKPHHFFRGNKGYLINLAQVDGIEDGCAVVRGERLLLSRARKGPFLEALTDYWSNIR